MDSTARTARLAPGALAAQDNDVMIYGWIMAVASPCYLLCRRLWIDLSRGAAVSSLGARSGTRGEGGTAMTTLTKD